MDKAKRVSLFCERRENVNSIFLTETGAVFFQIGQRIFCFHTGSEFPDKEIFTKEFCFFPLERCG